MEKDAKTATIIEQMRTIIADVQTIGPFLEGDLLQNKKNKHVKKDGTVSWYKTSPILQYRVGPGKRKSKRIKADQVEEIKKLLAAGKRYRQLMVRYQALAAELALDSKKKR
jgi:hypothetical protein